MIKQNRYAVFHAALRRLDAGWVDEYRFHPQRRWRFDFALPSLLLAIEVDGGIFTAGRHSRGIGQEADMVKGNEAILLCWSVLHFSTRHVHSGHAFDMVKQVYEQRNRPQAGAYVTIQDIGGGNLTSRYTPLQ